MRNTLYSCTGILFAGVLALAILPVVSHATLTNTSQGYTEVDLVSDIPGNATNTDARLVDPLETGREAGSRMVIDNSTGLNHEADGLFGFIRSVGPTAITPVVAH